MSATITTLHDFVEALAIRVPYDDIHPMSQCFMHEDISRAREMAHHGDDPAHIIKLMRNLRHRIARDLRWAAGFR